MFPNKVLCLLAQGVGLKQDELLKGLSTEQSEIHFAHKTTQGLRDQFLQRDSKQLDPLVWDLSFCPQAASFVSKYAREICTAARSCLPREVFWFDAKNEARVQIALNELIAKWRNGSSGTKLENWSSTCKHLSSKKLTPTALR